MVSHNCIIIDNTEIDRLTLTSRVKRFPQFKLLGVFSTCKEALGAIEFQEIDVLFLEIDMPDIDGISFRKQVVNVPCCVFFTKNPEYAAEAFNVQALDFLIKPVQFERFAQTVSRIDQMMEIRGKIRLYENSLEKNSILIKEKHGKSTRVGINEVFYLRGFKDYTLVVTKQKTYCAPLSIGNLLKEHRFADFIRIHKSFAVPRDFIESFSYKNVVLKNEVVLPIGRSHGTKVRSELRNG